jgi:hypothetical protein
MALTQKEQYAKMVCLFLAEGLRTRRISLRRSGEIAEKILQNINLVDTESDFLSLVKELSKDFEELTVLESKIARTKELNEKKWVEAKVREFAIHSLPADSQSALSILQDAADGNSDLTKLQEKYPAFKNYLNNHDK